jgi:hypothetical protein
MLRRVMLMIVGGVIGMAFPLLDLHYRWEGAADLMCEARSHVK